MNIDNLKELDDNQNNFSLLDSKTFGLLKMQDFINSQRNYFVQRFDFSGNLSEFEKELFFVALFDYGKAGFIKTKNGVYCPIIFTVRQVNHEGYPIKVDAWKASQSITGKLVEGKILYTSLTNEEGVFCMWDLYSGSGVNECFATSYSYGEANSVLRQNIKFTMQKYQIPADNKQAEEFAEALIDISKNFVKTYKTGKNLNSFTSELQKQVAASISASDVMGGSNFKPLLEKEIFNPFISEILEYITFLKDDFSELYARRRNTHEKAERNVSNEFDSDNINFKLAENRVKPFLNNFVKKFNEMFNENIKLIDNVESMINEDKEVKDKTEIKEKEIKESENDQI